MGELKKTYLSLPIFVIQATLRMRETAWRLKVAALKNMPKPTVWKLKIIILIWQEADVIQIVNSIRN